MKKFLLSLLFFISVCPIFSTSAKYSTEKFTLNIKYNEEIIPGDAVFVKMDINVPKSKRSKYEPKAELRFLINEDKITSTPFYITSKKKNNSYIELLAGIPISPWLEEDNYSLKVLFTISDENIKEFNLPISFIMREFNSETIYLDSKNTAIKTDTSTKRMTQIDKLNEILYTSLPTSIYHTKAFISPTTSERYTSYYGDRRVYQYSNGKSSTSLHYGNDYGIPEGSQIVACGEGKIVMAEDRVSTGYSIVIEHLPGLYSLYYHLSQMNVKEGDYVKEGDLIGLSGSTGLATGPHLHWEIRLNGSAVRPEFFLNNFTFLEN